MRFAKSCERAGGDAPILNEPMKRSEARRYAQIAAAIAVAITLTVVVVFLRRSYQAQQAQKSAPPPVPAEVERNSQGFSFSKVEGTRTLFTVRATQATQMKGSSRSVLQDVWITVYGRKSDRNDTMHTSQCEFDQGSGKFVCGGEVQLDLESAEDAKRPAGGSGTGRGASVVHIATRGVEFDRDTGNATTEQSVEFKFPGGEGRAVGVEYSAAEGLLELKRAVELKIQPPMSAEARAKSAASGIDAGGNRAPVELTSASLQFQREEHALLLRGPVNGKQTGAQGMKTFRASQLAINLDEKMRAQRMVASSGANGKAQIESENGRGKSSIAAQEFAAELAPAGWLEKFRALGGVEANSKHGAASSRLLAGKIEGEMAPRVNQPKTITASENVKMDSSAGGQTRHMETTAVKMDFALGAKGKGQGAEARHAETNSATTISWDETANARTGGTAGANRGPGSMKLNGQRMEMEFGAQNRLKELRAHDGTELHRKEAGKPEAISSSRELAANFDAQGQWTELNQSGKFQLRNGEQTAQAERAKLTSAPEIVTLDENAQIGDGQSVTAARAITLNQETGDTRADGSVVTTYLSAGRGAAARGAISGPQLGAEPAHVSADHLQANSKSGVALYTGHARMWQGDTTMEAAQIQLDQKARRIDAKENVRALFVQMPRANAAASAADKTSASGRRGTLTPAATATPELWHVRAGSLTYWDGEARAHAEGGVQADSMQTSMKCRTADFFFQQDAAANGAKTQRMNRAVGEGEVNIRARQEHGTAEHAEYDAAAEKLVLSGGNPTFFDSSGNKTTGRQLTVNLADDTIQVQSEEGSRTLPRHRIEK
jgi:lipopolysaccharide export system protein LptA